MFKYRKVVSTIYRALFLTALWILIHLGGIFLALPIATFGSLKRKKIPPPITDDLLLVPATILAKMIRERNITSEQLVSTYIRRIKEVNHLLNAIVEERFVDAIDESRRLDLQLKEGTYRVDQLERDFPLYGVPITVKESIAVRGMSHKAGMICSRGRAEGDADAVRRIREAGAVIVAVTNTPELCLDWECYNKVTGQTSNPYDNRRTSGGSSGGEAALLGCGASVVGLGSDALGSLRLPAHFCGIFSHKPTGRAVSIDGHYPNGEDALYSKSVCIGPMVRYASDLNFLMKIICQDEAKKTLDLDREMDFSKLTIFYTEDWDYKMLHPILPEISDAINATVSHFHDAHKSKIIKWKHPDLARISESALLTLISIEGVDDIFENDPTKSPVLELIKFFLGLSDHCFYPIGYMLLQRYFPVWNIDEIKKSIAMYERAIENILGKDGVLVCPVYPFDAPYHREIFTRGYNNVYMSVFNTLGLPVSVCPLGFSEKGLPIGLQIVGRSNCDRLTIGVAEELERVFGGWKPPDSFETS